MLNFLLQGCRLSNSRPHGAMEARWTSNPYGGEVIQRLQVRILLRSFVHFFINISFFPSIFNFFHSFSTFFYYVFSRFWNKYFFPDENTMQNRSFIFICYHAKWISNPFRFFQICAVYSAFIPFSFVVFVLHTFSVSKNKLLSIFVDSESMYSTIENSISAGVFVIVQHICYYTKCYCSALIICFYFVLFFFQINNTHLKLIPYCIYF